MMIEHDQQAIQNGIELFSSVYHKNISEDVFTQKHFNNPDRLETSYIIEHKKNRPVAMRWMMKLGFSFDGKKLSGVQSSDDAVLPEARGLLFLKMRKKTIDYLKEEQTDFEYGCFSQGEAMEIAEKFGEKNVLNLQMARLFLHEKKHHWKRYDVPYPAFLSNFLMEKRKKKLRRLVLNRLDIQILGHCPFSDDDYSVMNSGKQLQIERNAAYYQWKTEDRTDLIFITARKEGILKGFIILRDEEDFATIADWDIFGEKAKEIIAAMILPICNNYQYIDIPSLNPYTEEMKIFTDIGCKDMSQLWAPICICVNAINEKVKSIVYTPQNWKHRLIDADFFMNR